MTIQLLIDTLKKNNKLKDVIRKSTLIVNEKSETQGALFFISIGPKECKILLPAPYHLEILEKNPTPANQDILEHREALLLK